MKPGRGLWHSGAQRRSRSGLRVSSEASGIVSGGVANVDSASRTMLRSSFGAAAGVGDDNGRRATAAVMRYGYRRGECFEGYEPRLRGTALAARAYWSGAFGSRSRRARAVSGNAANLVRTRLQHAWNPRAEQAVEVVGIHEGGTGCAAGGAGTPKDGGNTDRELTHRG